MAEHDDAANVFIGDGVMGGDEKEKDYFLPGINALSVEHLALHLPKLPGCFGCQWECEEPVFMLKGPFAAENIFGALVLANWLDMRKL